VEKRRQATPLTSPTPSDDRYTIDMSTAALKEYIVIIDFGYSVFDGHTDSSFKQSILAQVKAANPDEAAEYVAQRHLKMQEYNGITRRRVIEVSEMEEV